MKNGIVLVSCIFGSTVFRIFNLWPINMFNEVMKVFFFIRPDVKKGYVATYTRVP